MPINLSCIDLSVDDLLQCSFGLTKSQVSALLVLLEAEDWIVISELAKVLGKDRSVIQREIASLLSKELVERDQRNKVGGGYEYLYRAKDKTLIKRTIIEKSRSFCSMVRLQVERW